MFFLFSSFVELSFLGLYPSPYPVNSSPYQPMTQHPPQQQQQQQQPRKYFTQIFLTRSLKTDKICLTFRRFKLRPTPLCRFCLLPLQCIARFSLAIQFENNLVDWTVFNHLCRFFLLISQKLWWSMFVILDHTRSM